MLREHPAPHERRAAAGRQGVERDAIVKPLSATVNVVCDCGRRFVALARPPDWCAYCPHRAALCRVTITLEVVG